ncbi:uncharacterized protein [Branchiostoma lanceolatum]|uniref:uncharacterized protein isoform X1 n=1 Tax=Branchiostoma lanceolatum TaxID=7740 RepID=UPI0034558DED
MTRRLAACLMNISEGRSRETVEAIAMSALRVNDKITRDGGCRASVLNIFSDHDYNRSVLTIASTVEDIGEAVFQACTSAYLHIDLSRHEGGHPRLGSVDLVPLHPLSLGVTLQECGEIATGVAHRLASTTKGSASFLFGHADRPLCRPLAQRRREVGWFSTGRPFEELRQDVGDRPSSRYGITAIGAIPYMMVINVTIDTQDLKFGQQIVNSIRGRTPGGLPGVQAMAFTHQEKVEIACNIMSIPHEEQSGITDSNLKDGYRTYERDDYGSEDLYRYGEGVYTPPSVVERRIQELAAEGGVRTVGSNVVGFTPHGACQLAEQALSTGQAMHWKTRTQTTM